MSDQITILGMGFKSDATYSALETAARGLCDVNGVSPDVIVTLVAKAKYPPFMRLAENLDARIRTVTPDDIRGITTPTQSARIQALFGTGSVAEAVALAAFEDATLHAERQLSTDNATQSTATAALALAPREKNT
ncbi:cobalamin biosynthesis protein [Halocynthiibacter sp.]|uniref:cobalamin biosynthesis protein n=1 Tax=Halocynthiibacter sp. TaxID=1979210 RepID=UPI003C61C179